MVNAQEWLDKYYPKEGGCILEKYKNVFGKKRDEIIVLYLDKRELEGSLDLRDFPNLTNLDCSKNQLTSLDLSNCPNLTNLDCSKNQLTSLDLSNCPNLTKLYCYDSQLTSIDFLKQLPHPDKIIYLWLANNNIESTNLEFLRPFINIEKKLTLGNDKSDKYNNNIYNRFYGSLEPLRNMSKLPGLCIDGTDVEEGLEYLPTSIDTKCFNCTPKLPNQKVAKIQEQLRPFNYDIQAWQLAHPHKMYKAHPHLFELPESREKWLNAVIAKIEKTQQKLEEIKIQEPDKVKKIKRMELKIDNLSLIKKLLEERSIFEDSLQTGVRWYDKFKEDKATQTDSNNLELEQQKTIQELEKKVKELMIEKNK